MYFAEAPPDEPLGETDCCGFNVFNVYSAAVQIEIYTHIYISDGTNTRNREYRNFFWYWNWYRRLLIKFPILKTILWNLYVCNLNYNLRILGLEYE